MLSSSALATSWLRASELEHPCGVRGGGACACYAQGCRHRVPRHALAATAPAQLRTGCIPVTT
eukprot:6245473-Lingulodinium_polyedra.AAC.1